MNAPKILVIGSTSVDLVLNTQKHPAPHETVMADKAEYFFGGKGANQAVGTSRLGAKVKLIGMVGKDRKGAEILYHLEREGVSTTHVVKTEEAATGSAYVTAAEGKNAIVIVPAANHYLKPEHVVAAEEEFKEADLILIQLEIPMDVVEETIKLAKKYDVKVGIYAAPAAPLSPEIINYASFIVAKSSELPTVFQATADQLLTKTYPNKLFVRDDTNSTTYYNGSEMKYFRNDHDELLHKMGMGDAFTSGFAMAFCRGLSTEDCVKYGNQVSLKVAINRGSQAGLPYAKDLED